MQRRTELCRHRRTNEWWYGYMYGVDTNRFDMCRRVQHRIHGKRCHHDVSDGYDSDGAELYRKFMSRCCTDERCDQHVLVWHHRIRW